MSCVDLGLHLHASLGSGEEARRIDHKQRPHNDGENPEGHSTPKPKVSVERLVNVNEKHDSHDNDGDNVLNDEELVGEVPQRRCARNTHPEDEDERTRSRPVAVTSVPVRLQILVASVVEHLLDKRHCMNDTKQEEKPRKVLVVHL